MKYLYYPSFEINDTRWLKFAMLYFDKVVTIMPKHAFAMLSPDFQMISSETNLIGNEVPNYQIAEKSTRLTIDYIETIIKHPKLYFSSTRTLNPCEMFRKEYNVELFSEKYNQEFKRYLLSKKFGLKSDNGVFVNSYISGLFMSILARELYYKGDYNLVTDTNKIKYDSILEQNKEVNIALNDISELKIAFEMRIPNIDQMGFREIIDIRNSDNYLDNLRAFNRLLNDFRANINENLDRHNILYFMREIEETASTINIGKIRKSIQLITTALQGFFSASSGFNPIQVAAILTELGFKATETIITRNKDIEYKNAHKLITTLSEAKL